MAATGNFVRQGLIRGDGRIVEPADGSSPLSFDIPDGNYFVVVKHRNHLGFRSAGTQSLVASASATTVDFATNLVPTLGALKQISGVYCAFSGNANNTDPLSIDIVNSVDYSLWQTTRFQLGYKEADINLDGIVNSIDYNQWQVNRFKTAQY